MTKRIFAFAVLASLSALAQAQTFVALDGRIKLGVARGNGHSAELGRCCNNWLRLIGCEDLCDGLSAGVTVEMRYKPAIGTAEPTLMGSARVRLATVSDTEISYVLAARYELRFGPLRFGVGKTRVSLAKQTAGYIVALLKRAIPVCRHVRQTAHTTQHGAAQGIAHMF